MLVILVGPKGSGKTTIGKVLGEASAHIAFLEVEKIFLQVMRKYDSAVFIERICSKGEAILHFDIMHSFYIYNFCRMG